MFAVYAEEANFNDPTRHRGYPAALHDVFSVYRAIVAEKTDGITLRAPLLGGDSAGGGLAVALALVARGAGMPSPGVLLLSP